MHWYASYRTGGSTVMHVFKRREDATAAASEFLDRGYRDALEVGPMSENPEGSCSTSETSGGSGINRREQQRPHQPLRRGRARAREPDDGRGGHG
jgi:hypothetical protein